MKYLKAGLIALGTIPCLLNLLAAQAILPVWPSQGKSMLRVTVRWAQWSMQKLEPYLKR